MGYRDEYTTRCYSHAMAKTQIRIDRAALDRWKELVGVKLEDGAAANAAIHVAADMQRRELSAKAAGMQWLLGWIADGHADPGALVAGDVEVRVTDTALHVRIGAAHFHIGTNPTAPAHAVKVAAEVAKEAAS